MLAAGGTWSAELNIITFEFNIFIYIQSLKWFINNLINNVGRFRLWFRGLRINSCYIKVDVIIDKIFVL